MGLKQELLRQADDELRTFLAALAGLDEAALTQDSLDGWSARDLLAHLIGWHREMVPVLERLARGEKPLPDGVSYDDVEAWNTRFVLARRDIPATVLRQELEQSHREFMAAANRVPDERFAPERTATRIVEQNGPHHYREHAAQVRSWRARREG